MNAFIHSFNINGIDYARQGLPCALPSVSAVAGRAQLAYNGGTEVWVYFSERRNDDDLQCVT